MKPKRETLFLYLDSILSMTDGMWYKPIMTGGKTPCSLMTAEHLPRCV